jgi:hypothetical protein
VFKPVCWHDRIIIRVLTMFPVFRKEIDHSDTIHVSLMVIMLLIRLVKSLSLEEGFLDNGLSLGVYLMWLPRGLVIPPWVINPVSFVVRSRLGIQCHGMPHGAASKCFSDETFEVVSGGDFLPRPSWLLDMQAVTSMGLLACAGGQCWRFSAPIIWIV